MMRLELQKMPVDPEGEWVMPAALMIRRDMFGGNGEATDPEIGWVTQPEDTVSQYCLMAGGILVAFARLSSKSKIGIYDRGAYELKHIVVSKKFQRQGVGGYLLRCMEREAAVAGAPALDVRPLQTSRPFYIKHLYGPHPDQRNCFTKHLAVSDYTAPVPSLEVESPLPYPRPVVEQVSLNAKLFDNRGAYL